MKSVRLPVNEAAQYTRDVSPKYPGSEISCMGCEEDGKLQGVLVYETEGSKCNLLNIDVFPEYRGKRVSSFLLEKFLFLMKNKKESITASFDCDDKYGFIIGSLLSTHGFDIRVRSLKQYELELSDMIDALEKSVSRKQSGMGSQIIRLDKTPSQELRLFFTRNEKNKNLFIRFEDVLEADAARSFVYRNEKGQIESLLLVKEDKAKKELNILALWSDLDNPILLYHLFSKALENAREYLPGSSTVRFICVDDVLQRVVSRRFPGVGAETKHFATAKFYNDKFVAIMNH